MTLIQKGSSLYKAKLARRQIEELRANGETASDAANPFKNFPTVDSAFGDVFTVLLTFVSRLRMLSFVHDVQVCASPNFDDGVI